MLYESKTLALEVKNMILKEFLGVDIEVVFNENLNEYFFYFKNRELYYSDAFQKFVFDLEMNILWKQNIHNFYFALDLSPNQFENIVKEAVLNLKELDSFVAWNVCTDVMPNNNLILYNYSMAA